MGIDIDVGRMLLYAVNVAILVLILTKLLYKPVSKFLKERQDRISAQLDDAAARQQEARQLRDQYDGLMQQSRSDAAAALRQSREQAQQQADAIVAEAREQARQIVAEARSDVDKQMKLAREQSHEQVVEMAVQMASRILGREVSAADNAAIIESYFEGQDEK